MQNTALAMMDALTPSLTQCPTDDPHVCPHCNQLVPKLVLLVLGIEKTVQPHCKCEVQAYESGITESVELQQKREIEAKFSISSLGERFTASTFEQFMELPGTEKAADRCKSYADTFPGYGGDALMVWGPYGNGKSHLAAAVAHKVKDKGHTVVFQSMPELLTRIKNTFNRNEKETEKSILDALLHCDLLIIDDIGAEKLTDWVPAILFQIVDGRYRQKRPIFYTTNLKPSELKDQVGPRIYDRMMETSILVENNGASYRMKIAETRYRQMKIGEA